MSIGMLVKPLVWHNFAIAVARFKCKECGREVIQQPKYWNSVCHRCSGDCLME